MHNLSIAFAQSKLLFVVLLAIQRCSVYVKFYFGRSSM